MIENTISVADSKTLLAIFGTCDQHLRRIRQALGVKISVRDHQVRIQGEQASVAQATEVIEGLKALASHNGVIAAEEVNRMLERAAGGQTAEEPRVWIDLQHAGRKVEPKSPGQAKFIRAMREHDIVFAIGPAGTGKTYLAVAQALSALRQEAVRKIVLVRPAVEAGESLGYLPGDLQAKIHPYLRPLLDALRELLDYDQVKRLIDQDLVEVIPLAYMRGRTLNEAFIILDEAQNTSVSQMKMFLTRLGHGSKIVVVGDVTQIDLAPSTKSGLIDALHRLKRIPGLSHVELTDADIVRHPLVQAIVLAYEEGRR